MEDDGRRTDADLLDRTLGVMKSVEDYSAGLDRALETPAYNSFGRGTGYETAVRSPRMAAHKSKDQMSPTDDSPVTIDMATNGDVEMVSDSDAVTASAASTVGMNGDPEVETEDADEEDDDDEDDPGEGISGKKRSVSEAKAEDPPKPKPKPKAAAAAASKSKSKRKEKKSKKKGKKGKKSKKGKKGKKGKKDKKDKKTSSRKYPPTCPPPGPTDMDDDSDDDDDTMADVKAAVDHESDLVMGLRRLIRDVSEANFGGKWASITVIDKLMGQDGELSDQWVKAGYLTLEHLLLASCDHQTDQMFLQGRRLGTNMRNKSQSQPEADVISGMHAKNIVGVWHFRHYDDETVFMKEEEFAKDAKSVDLGTTAGENYDTGDGFVVDDDDPVSEMSDDDPLVEPKEEKKKKKKKRMRLIKDSESDSDSDSGGLEALLQADVAADAADAIAMHPDTRRRQSNIRDPKGKKAPQTTWEFEEADHLAENPKEKYAAYELVRAKVDDLMRPIQRNTTSPIVTDEGFERIVKGVLAVARHTLRPGAVDMSPMQVFAFVQSMPPNICAIDKENHDMIMDILKPAVKRNPVRRHTIRNMLSVAIATAAFVNVTKVPPGSPKPIICGWTCKPLNAGDDVFHVSTFVSKRPDKKVDPRTWHVYVSKAPGIPNLYLQAIFALRTCRRWDLVAARQVLEWQHAEAFSDTAMADLRFHKFVKSQAATDTIAKMLANYFANLHVVSKLVGAE